MKALLSIFCLFTGIVSLSAQPSNDSLVSDAKKADSLFWNAYNHCDLLAMTPLVDPNIEFYHDKGGITLGDTAFLASIRRGLCSDTTKYRLRRVAVEGKNIAHPMMKDGKVYGVLMAGSHYFFLSQNGEKEHRDGLAQFADLWLLRDSKWKLARVFSYNHHPAPAL